MSHVNARIKKTVKFPINGMIPSKNNDPKIIPTNTPKMMNISNGMNTNMISPPELLELRSMRSVQTALMPNRKLTDPHIAMITKKVVPLLIRHDLYTIPLNSFEN